jgi:hypothetical protein
MSLEAGYFMFLATLNKNLLQSHIVVRVIIVGIFSYQTRVLGRLLPNIQRRVELVVRLGRWPAPVELHQCRRRSSIAGRQVCVSGNQ